VVLEFEVIVPAAGGEDDVDDGVGQAQRAASGSLATWAGGRVLVFVRMRGGTGTRPTESSLSLVDEPVSEAEPQPEDQFGPALRWPPLSIGVGNVGPLSGPIVGLLATRVLFVSGGTGSRGGANSARMLDQVLGVVDRAV
jgi:hypothetical protein